MLADSSCTGRLISVRSEVDGEAAARHELALELHHAAQPDEAFGIGFAVARVEHADAVDDGGDGRTDAAAEVVAVCADARRSPVDSNRLRTH